MLIDEVIISIKAGDGGNGAVSFRREKYVPRGGPDGGDGGRGGSVYLVATHSAHGLGRFKGQKDFKAVDGERGGKNKRHGVNGDDLILTVPVGTQVHEILPNGQENLLVDLDHEAMSVIVAKGGRGGKGNWHFRGPTNQTPREFQPGKPGEARDLRLQLQLIADVGLIGLPNAGKSTLLSVISNARPKIADYPFTTLQPNLGLAGIHGREFVVADIPGLIAGASSGKGLGIDFLKHIRRTGLLVHLVAATDEDPEESYSAVRAELLAFDEAVADKVEIVVMTKIDIVPDYAKVHADFIAKHKAIAISAAANENVKQLLMTITEALPTAPEPSSTDSVD